MLRRPCVSHRALRRPPYMPRAANVRCIPQIRSCVCSGLHAVRLITADIPRCDNSLVHLPLFLDDKQITGVSKRFLKDRSRIEIVKLLERSMDLGKRRLNACNPVRPHTTRRSSRAQEHHIDRTIPSLFSLGKVRLSIGAGRGQAAMAAVAAAVAARSFFLEGTPTRR